MAGVIRSKKGVWRKNHVNPECVVSVLPVCSEWAGGKFGLVFDMVMWGVETVKCAGTPYCYRTQVNK